MDEREGGKSRPVVGIIMGSDSDWKTMRHAAEILTEFGIPCEAKVVSAHRSPDYLFEYANGVEDRGLLLLIAGAGGAAHLPGMAASKTIVPVIGVPVNATLLNGLDALLSIMQMPAEVGVATVSIGEVGARRAAIFAVAALTVRNNCLHTAHGGRGKVVILAEDEPDLQVLQHAEEYLGRLGVLHETAVVGRTSLARRLADLKDAGTAVFIAGSARGIDFARDVATVTAAPVLAVPIVTAPVGCVDEFLRPFLDMPPRLATFAIGRPGAINAALFAATIISERESEVWIKLRQMRRQQVEKVRNMKICTQGVL